MEGDQRDAVRYIYWGDGVGCGIVVRVGMTKCLLIINIFVIKRNSHNVNYRPYWNVFLLLLKALTVHVKVSHEHRLRYHHTKKLLAKLFILIIYLAPEPCPFGLTKTFHFMVKATYWKAVQKLNTLLRSQRDLNYFSSFTAIN